MITFARIVPLYYNANRPTPQICAGDIDINPCKGSEILRDLSVLSAALEIVEQRLRKPMNAADLAKACFLSYSGLQKLFGYVFSCSVAIMPNSV